MAGCPGVMAPGENSINRQLCNFKETVVLKKAQIFSIL
jgi:hypothetical protein